MRCVVPFFGMASMFFFSVVACGGSSSPLKRPQPAVLDNPSGAEAEKKGAGVIAAPETQPAPLAEEPNERGESVADACGVDIDASGGFGQLGGLGHSGTGGCGGALVLGREGLRCEGCVVRHGGMFAPSIRQGAVSVTGRLPPEIIQRIVRQNFGRFRLCYEQSLRSSPHLKGRVQIKFIIDEKGDVSTAADDGSDLPDKNVITCVLHGFEKLSFPKPESGTVSVVYPILFAPPARP